MIRICYSAASYVSHRRTAAAYREVLQTRCELLPEERYTEADVIILHHEPNRLPDIYRSYPKLAGKYVVGCCVWEATDLPPSYRDGVRHVQEIWTCSRYAQAAFARHHPRVFQVPWVVDRDMACAERDLDRARQAIGYDADHVYFLSISKLWDRRKNAHGLVEAFVRQSARMPRARLIVKASGVDAAPPVNHPQIVWLFGAPSDAEINALYHLSHIYVSPHSGEGWGLTMSDAMLFGKPVIATGYSGNLEFMHGGNSWLLRYTEEAIRPEDCYHLFDSSMQWGYPDPDDLDEHLRLLYETHQSAAVAERVQRAAADLRRFEPAAVEAQLLARLQTLGAD
jgi:glycosyltransferase involved in cell wall biosynthesis